MKKTIAIIAACGMSASLAGCGYVQDLFSTDTTKNAAAVAVLTKQAVLVVCDISALASVAAQVEVAAQSAQSVLGTTNKVLAGSTAACTGLGALYAGTVTAPAGTTYIAQ